MANWQLSSHLDTSNYLTVSNLPSVDMNHWNLSFIDETVLEWISKVRKCNRHIYRKKRFLFRLLRDSYVLSVHLGFDKPWFCIYSTAKCKTVTEILSEMCTSIHIWNIAENLSESNISVYFFHISIHFFRDMPLALNYCLFIAHSFA